MHIVASAHACACVCVRSRACLCARLHTHHIYSHSICTPKVNNNKLKCLKKRNNPCMPRPGFANYRTQPAAVISGYKMCEPDGWALHPDPKRPPGKDGSCVSSLWDHFLFLCRLGQREALVETRHHRTFCGYFLNTNLGHGLPLC